MIAGKVNGGKRPKLTVWTKLIELCGGERGCGIFGCEVPRQELSDAVDGVVGDAREDVTQVALGIDSIQFGRANPANK